MTHFRRIRPSAAVLVAVLSFAGIQACNQNSAQTAQNTQPPPALPLTTGAETAPVYAPSAAALPAAPRPKIVRVASQADQYAYVDQAATMGSTLGSAPPDYGFDYGGVHPWVWRASNNALRLIEPTSGGDRYYYYQPGAARPYLIRDSQYAYGFNDGQLVVIYDARGDVLPPQYMAQQADYAGRYLARAEALYNASLQNERRSVIAANWAARRAEIDAQQAQWAQQQSQYAAWQAYHQEHQAEQQAYWQAERQRREAAAAQFNQWQTAGYQGPPPPPPPYAGVAGAAAVGGLIGGFIAGRQHDHGGPPPLAPQGYPPSGDAYGSPGRPGFNGAQGAQQAAQQAAIQQARQQQAQEDAQRQAQAQEQAQAQAAAAARAQAMQQGRQQEAAQFAAQQAAAQQQAHQIAAARSQQAAQDAAAQHRQEAAAQQQALEAQQAREQHLAQAAAQQQAQAAARAQAHEQQAGQAAAQRQAQEAAHAQALQAHDQFAAQAAAQRQAQAATRTQATQAHEQQSAQQAAQHQVQAEAAKAAATARAPHPNGPPPGGHDPKRDGEPHPAPN